MKKLKFIDQLAGLYRDERTGLMVGTKLASASGYLITSCLFIYHNIQMGYNSELWMIYMGIIAGHRSVDKAIGMKNAKEEKVKDNV